MIPDLRFIIGAVTAAVLLGVTMFGFVATVHIAQQSKVGPLEASRLLAYTSDDWHRIDALTIARPMEPPLTRTDSASAQLPEPPREPAALQPQIVAANAQPAIETAPAIEAPSVIDTPAAIETPPKIEVPPAIDTQPARLIQPADEADRVDERAVVDPPLPARNDPPAVDPPLPARNVTPAAAPPPPDVLHVGSIPVASDDPESEELATTKRARKVKRRIQRTAVTITPPASTGYPLNATSVASRQPTKVLWPGDID